LGRPAGEYQSADASDVGKTRQIVADRSRGTLRRGIAGAKLVSFEECGHVPPIEKRKSFSAAAMAFLGGGAAAAHWTEVWRRPRRVLALKILRARDRRKRARALDHDGQGDGERKKVVLNAFALLIAEPVLRKSRSANGPWLRPLPYCKQCQKRPATEKAEKQADAAEEFGADGQKGEAAGCAPVGEEGHGARES